MKTISFFTFLLCFLVAVGVFACLKEEDIPALPFFEVSMDVAVKTGLGTVSLRATIRKLDENTEKDLVEYGFLLSESNQIPAPGQAGIETIAFSQQLTANLFEFDTVLENLPIITNRYYVWAYAKLRERTVVSETFQDFSFSDGFAFRLNEIKVRNDSIICTSTIAGLETLSSSFQQHGHLFSAVHNDPKLGDSDITRDELGSINDDKIITSRFSDLAFNTEYWARAYVISANGEAIYSNVVSFRTGGGWKLWGHLPTTLRGAVVASDGQRLVLGVGCQAELECIEEADSYDRTIWTFDPNAPTPEMAFQHITDFPGRPRINATAFILDDGLYVGLGKVDSDQSSGFEYLKDFWRYDFNENMWNPMPDFPGVKREEAVSFTLDGKAYVGTGKGSSTTQPYQDFYQYDPDSNEWKEMADLPIRSNGGEIEPRGRSGAITFNYAGDQYVGLGRANTILADFWRFEPPTEGLPEGDWIWVSSLPEGVEAREGAAVFSIENRLFLGPGYNRGLVNGGYYPDTWEVFLNGQPWGRQTSFPVPGKLLEFVGFVADEKGYVAGGYLENGVTAFSEIWEFTPEN